MLRYCNVTSELNKVAEKSTSTGIHSDCLQAKFCITAIFRNKVKVSVRVRWIPVLGNRAVHLAVLSVLVGNNGSLRTIDTPSVADLLCQSFK